jgi:LuxR family maltose regulon positive regulatory protein
METALAEPAGDAMRDALALAARTGQRAAFVIRGEPLAHALTRRLRYRPDERELIEELLRLIGVELPDLAPLTARECALLRLLPAKLSAHEIGAELGITENTVRTHLRNLYRKLDVSTRAAAVERARTHGLLAGR